MIAGSSPDGKNGTSELRVPRNFFATPRQSTTKLDERLGATEPKLPEAGTPGFSL